MRNLKNAVLTAILVLGITSAFAQKTLKNATVTYQMSTDAMNPQTNEEMTINMELVLKVLNKKAAIDMNMNLMGMQMNMKTSLDTESKNGILLMDVMGQKMAAKINPADYDTMKSQNKVETPQSVEKTNKTKTILGYLCKHAIVTGKDGSVSDVYYTEKLNNLDIDGANQVAISGVDGLPLEYVTKAHGATITVTVEGIEENTVKASDFMSSIPEGYTEVTYEQLTSMGGAGM
ncbi:GLPGLI family protein [Pustulibacterium marinum]|uniref:GLPGLI family protein n=1 Tax=Pustulibacterium marinum TaxID=1224947 RepID=A0A1I7F3A9_9FLAO|nr:DUF4412 domain-containing protein [Pustulibacterium marinum]SFU30615.1 GLPGLI family protein [Pustulibacterium marinum]